jgi:hypothetical protein
MLLAGVPPRDVRFGVQLRRLGAFATTTTAMSARAYRVACALPLVVLGAAPLLAGLAFGIQMAARFGAVMVVVAGGDVAILLALRGVPPEARIVDHATEPGFHLLAPDQARPLPAHDPFAPTRASKASLRSQSARPVSASAARGSISFHAILCR